MSLNSLMQPRTTTTPLRKFQTKAATSLNSLRMQRADALLTNSWVKSPNSPRAHHLTEDPGAVR